MSDRGMAAVKLPEHSHCANCGDPIPFGTDYCSEKCMQEHAVKKRRTAIRDFAFYATIAVALCLLAYAFIF